MLPSRRRLDDELGEISDDADVGRTTLQIAWSGVLLPKAPIFPSLREERFMAYQAIVAGARGLIFFGGDLVRVMRPADGAAGWNWTFWHTVYRFRVSG